MNVTLWDIDHSPFGDCDNAKFETGNTFHDLDGCQGATVEIGKIIFDKLEIVPTFTEESTSFCPVESCEGANQTLTVPTGLLSMSQGHHDLAIGIYGLSAERLKYVDIFPMYSSWIGILGCAPKPNYSTVT